MKYRAYVDGLRAVAILPVLTFHANLGTSGGFVGVDIFFVISGFLITGLILKDLDLGEFSIFDFWERRIRRILPALALIVLATLAIGWFLFLPSDFKEMGLSVLWQASLAANFYFWFDSGYFANGVDVKPLLHTWSLAVEEQFYLLFPFLLMGVAHFCRKWLTQVILILGLVSFGLSIWGTHTYPDATFYLLPTRAWELLMGAFLASLSSQYQIRRLTAECLSYAGLMAIMFPVFMYSEQTRFPGAAAVLPCLGTAVIIWANGCSLTSLGKFLTIPPMVFVGLISYSLYLWHWPLLVYSKYWAFGEVPIPYRLLILAASIVLAAASWKFVETPFRKRVVLKSRPRVFAFAFMIIALLLLSGLSIYQKQGLPSRFTKQVLQYASGASDRDFRCKHNLEDAQTGNFIGLGSRDANQPVRVIVWGDSHAMAVMPAIDSLCKDYGVRGVGAAHSSTAPLIGFGSYFKYSLGDKSIPFNDAVFDFIYTNRIRDVILVASWDSYDDDIEKLRDHLAITARKLRDSGARTWIMKTVPRQPWKEVPKVLARAEILGQNVEKIGLSLDKHKANAQQEDRFFDMIAEADATILDPTECLLNSSGVCRAAADNYAVYADDIHLTTHGAMLLRPLFEPLFQHVAKITSKRPLRDHIQ